MCGPLQARICRRPWLKPVERVQYRLSIRCLVSFYKSRDNKYEVPKGPKGRKCMRPTGNFPVSLWASPPLHVYMLMTCYHHDLAVLMWSMRDFVPTVTRPINISLTKTKRDGLNMSNTNTNNLNNSLLS